LEDHAIWENERMFEIFGHTPEDGTIGKPEFLRDTLHPDDRAAVRLAISQALRDDAILPTPGRIRRRRDGAWRTLAPRRPLRARRPEPAAAAADRPRRRRHRPAPGRGAAGAADPRAAPPG
ncbi:PAS domain-containing protein, partial [Escherichia coli]|uniref:PAS domain-containing protein n=1 Tax=Escherichia coli TaxID=562 RepID=UPI001902BC20